MSIQKFEHPRTKKIISFEWDDAQGDPTPDVFDELEALEDSAGEVMAPPPVPKLSPEQEQARKAWDFQVHPSKSHFSIKSPETGKLLKGSVPKDREEIGQRDVAALMRIEKDFSETGADFAKSLEKPEDRIVPPPKLGLGMLQDTKIPENIQDILKTPAGEAGMKKGAKESMGTAMVPAVVLGKAAGYGMARVGEEVVQAAIGTPLQEQFKTTWATAQDPLTMATDGIKIAAAASPLAAAFVDKPEELLAATPAGQAALAGMDPESRSRYFDAHPLLAATEMGGDLALQLGAGLGAGGVGLSGGTTRFATIVKHLGWAVDPVNKLQFLAQEKATRSLAKAQELGLKELPKTVADDLVKDQEVLKKIQELQQAVATGNTAATAERWSGRLFLPGMAAGTVEGLDAALDENLPNDQRLMGLTGAIQSGGFTMLALYHATRQARNPQAGDFVSDPIMRGAMEKVLAAKAPKDAEAATAFLRKQWKEYDAAQAVKAAEAAKAEAELAAKQAEADAQLERFNTQLQDEMAPPVNPRGSRIQRPVAVEETLTPPPPVAAEAPVTEAPPVDIASLKAAEEAALTELSQAEGQFGEGSPEAVAAKQKAQAAAQERFMAEASQPQAAVKGARAAAGLEAPESLETIREPPKEKARSGQEAALPPEQRYADTPPTPEEEARFAEAQGLVEDFEAPERKQRQDIPVDVYEGSKGLSEASIAAMQTQLQKPVVQKVHRMLERLTPGLARTVWDRTFQQTPRLGIVGDALGYSNLKAGDIKTNPFFAAKHILETLGHKGDQAVDSFKSWIADTIVHEGTHARTKVGHGALDALIGGGEFGELNTAAQQKARETKRKLNALLSGTKDDITFKDLEQLSRIWDETVSGPEGEGSLRKVGEGKGYGAKAEIEAPKGFLQRKLEERLARARGEKPLPVPRASKYRPAPEAPKGMSPSEAKRILQEVGERERAEALKDPEYQKQLADEAKAAEEQARIDKLNKAAHTRALKTPARHIGVGEGGREGFSTAAPEGSEIAPPPKVEAPKVPKVEKPASAPEALKGMESDIDAEIKDAQEKVAKMTDGKAARGHLEDAQNALIADINMLHENEAIDAKTAEALITRVRKGMFPRDIVAPPPKVDTTPRLAPKKASEAGRVDPGVTMAIIGAGIGGTIGGVPGALVGGLAGGAMWSALARAAEGVKKGGKPVGKMSLPELQAFRREHEGTESWAVEKARDIQTIWLSATVGPIDTIWRNVVQGGAQGGLLAMSDTARAFSYAVGLKTPETEDSFYRTLHRAGRIAGMDLLRTMGDTVHKTMEGITIGEGKTKDRKLRILERMAKRFVDVDLNDRYNLVMSGEVEIGRGKTRQLRPAERVGRAMMLGASAVERSMRVSIMERYLAPIMAREGLTSDKSGYAKLLKRSLKDDALKLRIIEAMGKAESIALHRTKGLGSKQGGRIEKLMRFFEDVPLIPRLFVTQFPNYFINNFLTNIVETNGVLMRIGDALGVSPERGSARKHTAYARVMELALQEATAKRQNKTALDTWMAQNGTDYAAAKALHHTKRTAAQRQLLQDGNTLLQDYQAAKKAYGQHQEALKREFKSGYMGKDFSNQLRIMGALTMALGYAIGMQRTDDEQGPYDFTVGKDKAGKKKVKSLFPILAEFAPMWLIGDVMARRRKGSTYYGKDDQSFWDSRLATEIKALFTGTGRPIATDSDAGAVLEAFMTKEKSDDWQKVARKWAGNVGAQFGRGGTIGDVGRVVKSPKIKTRPDVAPGGEKESYGGVPQSFYRGIKGKYTEEGLTPSYDATSGDVRKALSLPEVLKNFGLSEREESPITRFLNTHPGAKKGFLRAVTGKKEWDEKFFAGVKRKLEVPFIKKDKSDVKLTIPQMLEDPSFSDAEKEALLSSHMGKAVEGLETGLQREALKRKDPMMIPPPLRKKLGGYEEKRKMDRDLRLEKRHFPREPRPLRRFEKKKLDQLMPEDITPIPISRWSGAGEVDRTANAGGPSPKLLSDASKRHGVDEKLLRAVIKVESGGKKGAVSHKGARGYMQVMPSTFRAFGGRDPHNAWENVMVGTKYLKHLLDMFGGDVEKALAAYNAGPTRVRSGKPLPGETVRYVQKVMAAYD